jgi:magnesium chelatase subunit D
LSTPDPRWSDAALAAQLLSIDPAGLGGALLRGGPEPARDLFLGGIEILKAPDAPFIRLPGHVDDERLDGGIDLAGTLAAGALRRSTGVLERAAGGILVVMGAERLPPGRAARIMSLLEAPSRACVIALDEGDGLEEAAPDVLADRLAFRLDLDGVRGAAAWNPVRIHSARGRLADVALLSEAWLTALCAAAADLGVHSLRAPILAARAARAHAALCGRTEIGENDVGVAARLVLGPRATRLPAPPEDDAEPPPPDDPESPPDREEGPPEASGETEIILAAARAAIPADLSARLAAGPALRRAKGAGGGSGTRRPGMRGRPVGVRPGTPGGGARLALIDTLRAAAPWQRVRDGGDGMVKVARGDLRIRRYETRTETCLIFAVDASGSAAAARLAEAKGAVELALADAYATRTHVGLVAFRRDAAEVLLSPTRSLARAKSRLAGLPGGGATPLAAGLETAVVEALNQRRRGRAVLIVLLTDGRANIARDGTPDRPRARSDAADAGRLIRAAGLPALFIDTGRWPSPENSDLAAAMGAEIVHLPNADARAVSRLVGARTPA